MLRSVTHHRHHHHRHHQSAQLPFAASQQRYPLVAILAPHLHDQECSCGERMLILSISASLSGSMPGPM
jgi:hypothetical protein